MRMEWYVFEDAKLADQLKALGVPVVKSFHTNKETYMVADKPEYARILMEHYADFKCKKSGVVCF